MTHTRCDYSGDRDEALVAYLYDEADPAARAAFDAHLETCAACRDELTELHGVRGQLGRWTLPAQSSTDRSVPGPQFPLRGRWWRDIPAWAQVAAALVFLGVSAGIANLDARYDDRGLTVRTGWSTPAAVTDTSASVTPWRSELAALEDRLRTEIGRTASVPAVERAATRQESLDADSLQRVRALIAESERRQERELALRLVETVRDANTQRQADLVKIDRSLGVMQNNTGMEVMKQRELLNYVLRTSQRQ